MVEKSLGSAPEMISAGLYVGCALSQAPTEFKQDVARLKDDLRQRGHDILEFVGEAPAAPAEVYRWDIENCVGACQAMLAVVDYPAIGLGWELATAANRQIPTLMVAEAGAFVTRLAIGAADVLPTIEFERYDQMTDIPEKLGRFLIRHLDPATD